MPKYKLTLKDDKKLKDYYGAGDNQIERDGEEDDLYVIIEGTRDGYGISQVEGDTMTVGALISYLSQFDSNTKVLIGNDYSSEGYYTYGSISSDSLVAIEIIEPEEEEDEDYE